MLYSWCCLLNGLAVAMQQDWSWATIVLGILAAVATAYMARLLSRYRSGSRTRLPDASGGPAPVGAGGS